jgi:hypothetical protein
MQPSMRFHDAQERGEVEFGLATRHRLQRMLTDEVGDR